jgi:outer membrane protein assembly factor BamB
MRSLNALLAAAGVDPFVHGGSRWEHLTPTTITREGDRGETDVQTFRDEDELCRYLLVRSLAALPPRRGARAHRPRLPVAPVDGADRAIVRWRRELPTLAAVVGHGRGLVVLRDTTGLVVDPDHGVAQVTVVDATSGDVVASWLPAGAVDSAFVVGATDDPVVVLSIDGHADAYSVAGDLLWSFARRGWEPSIDSGPVLVMQETTRWVDGTIRVGGDAVALDVCTGKQRWSRPSVSRPSFAYWGVPRLDRFFALDVDGTHVVVVRVDLATGQEEVLAQGDLPEAYAGAGPTVLEDLMDGDGRSGHLTIRLSVRRPDGRPGVQLGDVLVVAGDPVVRVVTTSPGSTGERADGDLLSDSFVPGRLVSGEGDVRCTDLDGRSIWDRAGRGTIRDRVADVVLMQAARPSIGAVMEAIADDGTTRWEHPGSWWAVSDGAAWIRDASTLSVLDAATGQMLWTGPERWPTHHVPGGRHHVSTRVVGDMLLATDGAVLQAFGRPPAR